MNQSYADNQTIINANNQIKFGLGYHWLNYEEFDPMFSNNIADSETGRQRAGLIEASLQDANNIYADLQGLYAQGPTLYEGHFGDGSPLTTNTYNVFSNISGKIGKGFSLTENSQLIPYLSLDYRDWNRDTASGSTLDDGPEVYSTWIYGAGVMYQYALAAKTVLTANAGLGYLYKPTVSIPVMNITLDQHQSWAESAGLAIDYALNQNWHLSAQYAIRQFRFGQSNTVSTGDADIDEPSSNTIEQSLILAIGYQFR